MGGSFVEWRRLRRQLYVDSFAVGLIGEFVIGTVPLSGIGGAGTPGLFALHQSFQNCTFTEKADFFEVAPDLEEALRVPFQGGISAGRPSPALRNRNTWHCSYGDITVRIMTIATPSPVDPTPALIEFSRLE